MTLAPKVDRAFAKLDLHQPAERVLRRIRAATPRPGVDLALRRAQKTVRVLRARCGSAHGGATPGSVRADGGKLRVACADAWLELVEVQLPGKRPVSSEALLRGLRIPDGEEAVSP